MKRILAVFLTLAMALNIAPVGALAAADSDAASIAVVQETDEASSQLDEETAQAIASDPFLQKMQDGTTQTETDADEIQMSGNGTLGNLLAGRINALSAENGVGYSPDYGITDIVMDGSRATVSYKSAEAADLVVACYTEDTQEMVASGTVRVEAAVDGTAELTINDVPAYYVVKGFLLNEEHAPLCNAYTKSLYTEAMDQIEKATADDFDDDRVLNLDQNLDTNFMVVNEEVSLVKDAASDVYADDDNQIYRFTNPGEEITSLEPGDVFVYGDDLAGVVVAKVKEIVWDGDTLVIYGDPDFDPDDAFEIIKIDDSAEAGDFTTSHDGNTGVPFSYDSEEELDANSIPFEEENSAPSGSTEVPLGFTDEIPIDDQAGVLFGKITYGISGGVTYFKHGKFNLEYVSMKGGGEASLQIGFNIKSPKWWKIPLGHADVPLAGGTLNLTIDPSIKFNFALTGEVHGKATVDFTYTTDHGEINHDETGGTFNAEVGVGVQGTAFVGFSLSVSIGTFGNFIKAEAELLAGADLTITLNSDKVTAGVGNKRNDSIHDCDFCLKIESDNKVELSLSVKIWNRDKKPTDEDLPNENGKFVPFKLVWKDDPMYYSLDYNEFGTGSCPHKAYLVVLTAKYTNGQALDAQGVTVYSRDADGNVETVGAFDKNNECRFYRKNGTYLLYATLDGVECSKTITVEGLRQDVELQVTSAADVALSGTCGENVKWKLTTDGQLIISGSGPMDDYELYWFDDNYKLTCDNPAPWWSTMAMMNQYPVTSLVIQDGVTHIGDCAFTYAKLTKVTIPGSVESIGYNAFGSMKTLQEVTLEEGVQSIGSMAFLQCDALEKLELPSTLTEIGMSAFSGCSKLEKLELPDGIVTLSSYAFNACNALEKVIVPGSVQTLGMYAFGNCANLNKVTIWKGIKDTGWYAFAGNTNLKTVVIPASVTMINYGSFDGCTALETVIYGGTEEEWGAIDIKSSNEPLQNATIQYNSESAKTKTSGECGKYLTWDLSEDGTLTVHFKAFKDDGTMKDYSHEDTPWDASKIRKVVLESGVTTVGDYAFNGCRNLTEVQLPASVDTIGSGAFGGCTALQELTLPKENSMGLTTIKANAFADSALERISLPDTMTTLEPYAFNNAAQLQSIVLPYNVTEIPEGAFTNCKNLTEVLLDGAVTSIGRQAFYYCQKLESITWPKSLTTLGEGAFSVCNALTTAVLPYGMTEIPDRAFSDCNHLESVTLPATLKKIGDRAFANTAMTVLGLPYGLESIGESAFLFSKLEKIQIPNSVKSIGKEAFSFSELYSVELPYGIREIPDGLFESCNFTSFTVPDSVTSIGKSAFYDCENMTSIQIPASVTSIGDSAFEDCSSLKEVEIPEGVPSIGEETFRNCWRMTDVTIPASVTAIGENAFYGCDRLETVHYTGKRAKWSSITIADGNDKLTSAALYCADDTSTASLTENTITSGAASDADTTPHAVFNGLVENGEYAVIVSLSESDPLNPANLLYINQVSADDVGVLDVPFRTSAQLTEDLYVVACRQDGLVDNDDHKPSTGGGGGGGAGIILVGGVVAVAAVAGVVLMMPVQVEGTVKLAGQPVANAAVQVLKDGAVAAQTTTDANGHFALKVRRGSYTLRVQWADAEGQPVTRIVDFKAPNANVNIAA